MKRIRKSRAARVLSWVTSFVMLAPLLIGMFNPPAAHAQQAGPTPAGNTLTVIVVPFANTDHNHTGGQDLAQWATDAIAVELTSSGRFEVIKPSDVTRQATDLGFRAPYDQQQLAKIASALGANAIVSGEVAAVHAERAKGGLTAVDVTMLVRVADASSGELINGAAQVGQAIARPGESDLDALARDAAGKAALKSVQQISSYTLPEGIITNSVTDTGGTHVLMNRGSRDGVQAGMNMLVMRGGVLVGRVRVGNVFADDSEGIVTQNIQGIRPEDTVRATFPMPTVNTTGHIVQVRPRNAGNSIATLGKVLLVLIAGIAIATAAKGNQSVTGVTAEPDIQNAAPAVRISWRDNLFGGGTLEYHLWRAPDAMFNFNGIPVQAIQGGARQTYDYPTPFDYWNGVNSFLRPGIFSGSGGGSGGGTGGGGGTGNGGGTNSVTSVTPAAGSLPAGFVIGQSYHYLVTAVIQRTVASINGGNNNGGGGGGGTGGGTGGGNGNGNGNNFEQVETQPVQAGQSTPVNQPVPSSPRAGQSSVNIRSLNFIWGTVQGADTYVVELTTDRTFMNRSLIVQLPIVYTTTLGSPIDLTNSGINGPLRRDPTFNNFITHVPGAATPTIWWRIGARNSADSPGPVNWFSRSPSDGDRTFRWIYSTPQSFQPAVIPPNPP